MTHSSHIKPFRMNITRCENAVVLAIAGSVSMTDAQRLQEKLEELAAERVSVIVLDLKEMDFICSVGLGAIIVGHLKCRHHSGKVRLVSPVPSVRELLETTRLTKLFDIYDSVEEALT
ncbi:MAG: STAS domain-containing protein [Planctomycetota bacterium]|nr:STAS domain-containing protein [Planctomycetota bacterium]